MKNKRVENWEDQLYKLEQENEDEEKAKIANVIFVVIVAIGMFILVPLINWLDPELDFGRKTLLSLVLSIFSALTIGVSFYNKIDRY